MGAWRPILEGRLRDWAERVIEAIAEALGEGPIEGASLRGNAGAALFLGYLAEARGDDQREAAAEACLERAVAAVDGQSLDAGLHEGISGIAWVVEHLAGDEGEDDPCANIDEALLVLLDRDHWDAPYDLIAGLAGLGVYFAERLPRPSAHRGAARVVDHLCALSQRADPGRTWLTPPELLPPHQRAMCPAGHYNLGVAHGVPGVIGALGALGAASGQMPAPALVTDAVAWLLSRKLPGGSDACYAYWSTRGEDPRPARSAWCYGDPGIAASLLRAARAAGEPAWERAALGIARHAARRPPERAGVRDAMLCHGAAGLAHIFNRLHQATGDEELLRAARFWFERTLALHRPGQGIGGYQALEGREGNTVWESNPGFLGGSAGVGLALVAAVSDLEPLWDRLLVTAVPPT